MKEFQLFDQNNKTLLILKITRDNRDIDEFENNDQSLLGHISNGVQDLQFYFEIPGYFQKALQLSTNQRRDGLFPLLLGRA